MLARIATSEGKKKAMQLVGPNKPAAEEGMTFEGKTRLHRTKKRIALFVEAHEGLGHFNVIRQLAEDLLDQDGAAEVMILSGTMHKLQADLLFKFDRCRIVHLPLVDLLPVGDGRFEYTTPAGDTYLKDKVAMKERRRVVQENLELFKPDVIVFEFYPFRQSFREPDMRVVQDYGNQRRRNILKICLCRDIIHSRDTAETLRRLKAFDYVLVRGDNSIIKLSDSQNEWAEIKIPVLYFGYFVARQLFRKVDVGPKDPILIFAGGGFHVDDIDFFRKIILARKRSDALRGRELIVYLSQNAKKYTLESQTCSAYDFVYGLVKDDPSVKLLEPTDHKTFCKAIANAAIVVTHGGYNTSLETLLIGTPLLVIPRFTISDPEQKMRAEILLRLGLATALRENELEPNLVAQRLVEAIQSFQANHAESQKPLKIDGSKRSACFILKWIEKHKVQSLSQKD